MKDYRDEETLRRLYSKYNSQKDVAEVCDCSKRTIIKWMDRFGIETTDSHSNIRDRDYTPVEHEPNTVCDQCGSEFWRKPSLKNGRNFCDQDCLGNWMSENRSGEDHPQYARVEVECANCGEQKEVTPSHHEKVENHFCGPECQVEYEDRTGENNPFWKGGKVEVECTYCGDKQEVYPHRYEESKDFFCDVDCRGKWATESFSGKNHPLWENYSGYYGEDWLVMRDKVRKRDNGECQICGTGKDELGQWPDVHHIKPVNEFDDPDDAHFLANLICLCSSCHGKVEQGQIEAPKPTT